MTELCSNESYLCVYSLLELGNAEVSERVTKELTPLKPTLKKLDFKGAQLLLSKLNPTVA